MITYFDESNDVMNLLLHEKPLRIMIGLRYSRGKTYPSMLAKFADCTYPHAVRVLDILEKNGLIAYEKKGRIKYVVLTEKGEEIAFLLEELYRKLKKLKRKF